MSDLLLETAATEPPPAPAEPTYPDADVAKPQELAADAGPDMADHAWADLSSLSLHSDQLGLAHPDVISLVAHLPSSEPVPLVADAAGIYRPPGFHPAPWSGFAYDMAAAALSGLAAGTRILTARGEIEVERLLPGDMAMALRGPALLPIAWIGRSVAGAPPIRIEAGALGPDMPRRTLSLGPDQAVFLQPIPVPARSLINGTTIYEAADNAPGLFHIDVGKTEVLLAEGIPLSSSHRASLRFE